jgi:hypothetical protein
MAAETGEPAPEPPGAGGLRPLYIRLGHMELTIYSFHFFSGFLRIRAFNFLTGRS